MSTKIFTRERQRDEKFMATLTRRASREYPIFMPQFHSRPSPSSPSALNALKLYRLKKCFFISSH
jgi:hypothetical protein